MKKELTASNLVASHYYNGRHELEFEVDGKKVFARNIDADVEGDEFYWDDADNVRKAVDEGDIEIGGNKMFELIVKQGGKIQDVENFDTFEELKQHLIQTDYFSWILDEQPETELPYFEDAQDIEDIEDVLEDYDYGWWSVEIKQNEGIDNMNEIKYPFFVEREEMAFDKSFNGELCHHTGRVMVEGPTAADWWNEYQDSEGELHYGR